jgi:hypothetical protein
MKDYIVLFRVGPRFQQASPEELQQIMLRSKEWIGGIARGGQLNGVVRLLRTGAVLKSGEGAATEGPYADGHDIVNGYLALKAANLAEAVEIAKGCPIFEYDGFTEIREIASA